MATDGDRPVTLRATSSLVSFLGIALFAALLLGDAALHGAWGIVLRIGPWLLLALWILGMLLVRPSIRLERDRLVSVNLGWLVDVPWALVRDVERRYQLRLVLDGDRRVELWGSPFAPRPRPRLRRRDEQPLVDGSLDAVRTAWLAWSGDPATAPAAIRRRPDLPALALGAGLLVLALASLLLPV